MKNFLVLVALGALTGGAVMAAPAKPMAKPAMKSSAMKSSTMMKTPTISSSDREYLRKDAQGSVYDQSTAQLALQKAKSPTVHAYAVMLTSDHQRLNTELFSFARSRKLTLPVTMMASDKTKLNSLKAKSGSAFDKAYLQEAVKINSDDVQKGTKEIASTKDASVKALVGGFVATERKHLAAAKSLLAKMK